MTTTKILTADLSTDYADLEGTVGFTIYNSDGSTLSAWSATGVVQVSSGSGSYYKSVTLDLSQPVRVVWTLTSAAGEFLASDTVGPVAVAGDAMALTGGERTTLAGVIWAVATSGLTTTGSIGKLLTDNLNRFATMIEQIGTSGLWRFVTGALTQAPVGQVQLVQGRFQLVADEAGSDGVLESYLGDTRTLRCQLTDGAGLGVDITSATLAAKLVDLAGTTILDSTVGADNLTLTTLLATEGRLEIVLPLSDSDLVAGRRYKLLVYRTVSGRRSTFPLDVLIGG